MVEYLRKTMSCIKAVVALQNCIPSNLPRSQASISETDGRATSAKAAGI